MYFPFEILLNFRTFLGFHIYIWEKYWFMCGVLVVTLSSFSVKLIFESYVEMALFLPEMLKEFNGKAI